MLIQEWISREIEDQNLKGKRICILITTTDYEQEALQLRASAKALGLECDIFNYSANAPIDEYIKYYVCSTNHYDAVYAPSLRAFECRYYGNPWVDGLIDYLIDNNFDWEKVVVCGPARFRSDAGHAFGYYDGKVVLDPSGDEEGILKLWGTSEVVYDGDRIDTLEWGMLAVIRLLEVNPLTNK